MNMAKMMLEGIFNLRTFLSKLISYPNKLEIRRYKIYRQQQGLTIAETCLAYLLDIDSSANQDSYVLSFPWQNSPQDTGPTMPLGSASASTLLISLY